MTGTWMGERQEGDGQRPDVSQEAMERVVRCVEP